MSICVCCRVKEKKINTEILEKSIHDFQFFPNDVIKETDKTCITYEDTEDNKEIISFVSEKTFPHNIYDSGIIGDYKYSQLLIFDIRKDIALKDEYKKIVSFCICLRKKINSDMLLTSDIYDDICLLEENSIQWSQTFPFTHDVGVLKVEGIAGK